MGSHNKELRPGSPAEFGDTPQRRSKRLTVNRTGQAKLWDGFRAIQCTGWQPLFCEASRARKFVGVHRRRVSGNPSLQRLRKIQNGAANTELGNFVGQRCRCRC